MKVGLMLAGMAYVASGVVQAADVAILYSDNSRAYFALHYHDKTGKPLPEEFDKYPDGWALALTSANVPPDVIADGDITAGKLAKYKLLILSNTVSLSDDQQKTIRGWVIRGGRLLATYGSGYKDIDVDPRQPDQLKLQEGGTSGLHQLWHDPMDKLFSSCYVSAPGDNPSDPVNNMNCHTDARITQSVGPTFETTGRLEYGYHSNLLVQRPENFPGALGFVQLSYTPPGWHPTPAILLTRAAQGLVVYFAFAPEFLVSSYPTATDTKAMSLRTLMTDTVKYLLKN